MLNKMNYLLTSYGEKINIVEQYNIFFLDFNKNNFIFDIKDNLETQIILILIGVNKETCKTNFEFNLGKNSNLNLLFADISKFSSEIEFKINLDKDNSRLEFYSSTASFSNYSKKILVNPIHVAKNTYSNITAYEVLKDESKGFIKCVSDIRRGAIKSEAHQEIRLTILDESAHASSDPMLLINENDIIASHANAIGMLDQEQIFYLLSRGLNEKESQLLIINGYFEPITANIEDTDLKEEFREKLKEVL